MVSSYEESRRKRMEENKKRMEALNLHHLSHALLQNKPSSSPKTHPSKAKPPKHKQKELVVVRRSARVANLPTPVYKEILVDSAKIPRVYKRRRDLSNRVYASDEARQEALEKAYKLESDLQVDEESQQHPTFVKGMLQSHVTGGFWLGLPKHFCTRNLPRADGTIDLIDEDGNEYPTIYLAEKHGLSGGWRGFAIAHELADGDALIFQLIKRTTFKIYIVRVNDSAEEEVGDQHE